MCTSATIVRLVKRFPRIAPSIDGCGTGVEGRSERAKKGAFDGR